MCAMRLLNQVRAHLDFAHTGLGLGVRDAEVRAAGGVEAEVPDPDVTEFADPNARAAECGDDRAPADVRVGPSGACDAGAS